MRYDQSGARAFLVAAFIALAASLLSLVVPSTRPRPARAGERSEPGSS